jgi:AraC-like DNA-binding protein
MIYYSDELPKVNFSNFICEKLNYDYTYFANLFSEVQGITIEHYIILHKIERIKELIVYTEMNLTQIVFLMQ